MYDHEQSNCDYNANPNYLKSSYLADLFVESYARNAYTVLLVKNDKTTKPLYM